MGCNIHRGDDSTAKQDHLSACFARAAEAQLYRSKQTLAARQLSTHELIKPTLDLMKI